MFIVGVVVGPALAIVVGDTLLKPGKVELRWVVLAVVALLLLIAVMPIFTAELKLGLIIGLPLGLLLAASPMAITPVDRPTESGSLL
jgi:hypothetical protein